VWFSEKVFSELTQKSSISGDFGVLEFAISRALFHWPSDWAIRLFHLRREISYHAAKSRPIIPLDIQALADNSTQVMSRIEAASAWPPSALTPILAEGGPGSGEPAASKNKFFFSIRRRGVGARHHQNVE
jgi:hypothetical protein